MGSDDSDREAHIFAPLHIVQVPATTQLRQSIFNPRVQFVEGRLLFCLQQAFSSKASICPSMMAWSSTWFLTNSFVLIPDFIEVDG